MKKIKNIFVFCLLTFFSFTNKIMAAPSCSGILGSDLTTFIVDLFDIVKWIALALAIVLGMLDFFKAITGGKDDALSKAAKQFAKRLVAVAVLFILPLLLEWILEISGIDHGGTCLDNSN